MKQILSLIFAVAVIAGLLCVPVQAADASSKPVIVSTSGSSLNVRSQPSANGAVLATLKKGSYVTLMGKTGEWWKVEYAKNQYGYCHSSYLTVASGVPATIKTQSGNLNVRSGPGTSYSKTGSLAKGETVIALSTAGSWSHILYHGTKTGYVSAQYLWGNGSNGQNYPAISLNIPSFKQTDSRWANVLIGQSGKTMAQIGCATTGLAMMESGRTGTTIYPHVMTKQLRYTASGSVYWPGSYTVVTNGSGYLSAVYDLLKQGKPVLLGAKNSNGSQHWVVITGYAGGNTLSASRFTIHDPGSSTRTNLQQFLNAYPTFYKYFHY